MLYVMFVEAGVVIELDFQVCRDKQGNIATSSEEVFGLPSEYEYIHPDYVLFSDNYMEMKYLKTFF